MGPRRGGDAAQVQQQGRKGLVPVLFVFEDSLVDSGNNNNMALLDKANYFAGRRPPATSATATPSSTYSLSCLDCHWFHPTPRPPASSSSKVSTSPPPPGL